MDNVIKEYEGFPLWLRQYIGSSWLSATKKDFQIILSFSLLVKY